MSADRRARSMARSLENGRRAACRGAARTRSAFPGRARCRGSYRAGFVGAAAGVAARWNPSSVHGHFYQPPRRGSVDWTRSPPEPARHAPFPRLERRELRTSATSRSLRRRLLDAAGDVASGAVNLYEWVSFDAGTTLASRWLEANAFAKYRTGDCSRPTRRERYRASVGTGTRLPCRADHVIFPLASRRDKVTEVRWGTVPIFAAVSDATPQGSGCQRLRWTKKPWWCSPRKGFDLRFSRHIR